MRFAVLSPQVLGILFYVGHVVKHASPPVVENVHLPAKQFAADIKHRLVVVPAASGFGMRTVVGLVFDKLTRTEQKVDFSRGDAERLSLNNVSDFTSTHLHASA